MSVLAFLLALPLSVYVLAGALSILDGGNRAQALTAFSLRLAVLCLLVVLTPPESRHWIGVAFVSVLVLHGATAAILKSALRNGRWTSDRID